MFNLYWNIFDCRDVGGKPQNGKDKCGATQYYLPGRPFMVQGAKSDATIGKVFVTQLLEGMYSLGYDFIVSSDLARTYDQVWIFPVSLVSKVF